MVKLKNKEAISAKNPERVAPKSDEVHPMSEPLVGNLQKSDSEQQVCPRRYDEI